jgi:hypothetical protein
MEKTNQEIWEEILRLTRVIKSQTSSVDNLSRAATKLTPIDHICFPVDFVADTEILVYRIETLDGRGARLV